MEFVRFGERSCLPPAACTRPEQEEFYFLTEITLTIGEDEPFNKDGASAFGLVADSVRLFDDVTYGNND